jgi:C1A family cysteine protease
MKSRCLLNHGLLLVSFVVAKDVVPRDSYKKFVAFEARFGKSYASVDERHLRLKIFHDNLLLADQMNAMHDGAVFGVTKFMDLTPAEFKARFLNYIPANYSSAGRQFDFSSIPQADPPASRDWRDTADVITPVKNQEQCGSCWAFSATESIESAWVQAGKSQVILGPQQIVDCDTTDGGCNGGNTETAYEYVIKAGGQETEKNYPYTGQDGTCRFHSNLIAASITSWKYISQSAESEMTKMLTYVGNSGPVSVCVDAAPWQYYTGGVLKTCGMQVDHCVHVVGYMTQSSLPVWIVRNSWGEDWGEQGYIWVEQGKNLCDIAGDVTVAII